MTTNGIEVKELTLKLNRMYTKLFNTEGIANHPSMFKAGGKFYVIVEKNDKLVVFEMVGA